MNNKDKDCMSPHVSQDGEGRMRLVWRKPPRAEDRVRVVAWSCHCRTVVFELCRAGGQSYTRRTEYDENGKTVQETHRWTVSRAEKVWHALLEGEVV